MYLGSDAIALAPFTDTITYLEDGDCAVLSREKAEIFGLDGRHVERPAIKSVASSLLVDKGNYRHFMAKEIHEQPEVISHTLGSFIDFSEGRVLLPDLGLDPAAIAQVSISACGTAYYAGLVGKYWLERYARIPVEIDVASEFRYREPPLPKGALAIFITQSGETADTLATLRYCKSQGQRIASIVNVRTSTIARESDVVLPTLAGPEIGVASTKAFTTQLAALGMLVVALARHQGADPERERHLVSRLIELPGHVERTLELDPVIQRLAKRFADKRHALFLGRGALYPIALEGALKLKEISYIHAEGYPAGELKHGPLALVDADMPVVAVAPNNDLLEKLKSNLMEVRARGGELFVFADPEAGISASDGVTVIEMPRQVSYVQAPVVYAIPLQLLAYHAAILKGTDVDQPRNLAKSVTVE
jgi:glucosamine--fructose-6-phosphate aminotransferase (isomerizing)